MSRKYYEVRYLLDNRIRYLLWHSDGVAVEKDGVEVDPNGKTITFRTRESALAYASAENLTLEERNDSELHNLDAVRLWLKRKPSPRLDCTTFLNAWNLLEDISATVGGDFDPDKSRTQRIYIKLFSGTNPPVFTPPGKCFQPIWSRRELRILREVPGGGMRMFRVRNSRYS